MKFKRWLNNLMYGRYGNDEFGLFLLISYTVIAVANVFIRSKIVYILVTLIAVYAIYRIMSRDFTKRRAENAKFRAVKSKVVGKFTLYKQMFSERKTHRYRKCPKCRAVLRLPNRSGTHTAKCPKCGERFDVKIR